MADYSLLGSFSTGGASQLNADLITKLKDAEKKSILSTIDSDLEKITGLDAETGKALDNVGEVNTFNVIKAQATDLMNKLAKFDLDSSSTTAFDTVSASTTGEAAVFDAVDVKGLEPGSTKINVSQLAQKDVYQSNNFNKTSKDGQLSADASQGAMTDDQYRDYIANAGLTIKVGDKSYDFNIVKNPSATTIAELGAKTIDELAAEINTKDELIASVEKVGEDSYRLVVKSTESGLANQVSISQNNFDLGFTNKEFTSTKVTDTSVQISGGNDAGDKITINGVDFSTEGKSYDDLANDINNYNGAGTSGDTFDASIVDGKLVVSRDDGADVTITQTGVDLGFYNSDSHHVQKAQNLKANIDGIDYDTASNTVTIQGNLKMTAVKTGDSTIDIQRDTSSIMTGLQEIITSYNSLSELIDTESNKTDSSISDISTLRGVMNSIKEQLFNSYGENEDLNLFNYGLEVDIKGKLSLDTTKFGKALTDDYDKIKDLFLGNTSNADTATNDATKFMGLGTSLQNYLDNLDSTQGIFTRYETSMNTRKTNLETERKEALETLDAKYTTMSAQFAQYAAVISQFESSFSGLNMMIQQSVARN